MKASFISAAVACMATAVSGNMFKHMGKLIPPIEAGDMSATDVAALAVSTTGSGFFDQLLDHDNPSKGTFKQKFWWNSEFWAGPGSPVGFTAVMLELDTDGSLGCVLHSG